MMCKLTVLWILFYLICDTSGASYKSCQINILSKKCPSNAICVQNSSDNTIGTCECIDNYKFNEDFETDSDYCLQTVFETTTQNANSEISSNGISITKTQNSNDAKDILLGILIIIVLICLILPAGFIIYKYGIWNWIHKNIIERGGPPQYEDVMIGQEDTDDDPLP